LALSRVASAAQEKFNNLVSSKLRPAVFLDRDGVINAVKLIDRKPFPPSNLEELSILDGVRESVERFELNGLTVVVVTNQPDIANGHTTFEIVKEIHQKITQLTGIRYFYVCHHNSEAKCICRKPKPGLLTNAASDLKLDLKNSFMVGDRWSDITAGQSVGCKNFFVNNAYLEPKPALPYIEVKSLIQASNYILENFQSE